MLPHPRRIESYVRNLLAVLETDKDAARALLARHMPPLVLTPDGPAYRSPADSTSPSASTTPAPRPARGPGRGPPIVDALTDANLAFSESHGFIRVSGTTNKLFASTLGKSPNDERRQGRLPALSDSVLLDGGTQRTTIGTGGMPGT